MNHYNVNDSSEVDLISTSNEDPNNDIPFQFTQNNLDLNIAMTFQSRKTVEDISAIIEKPHVNYKIPSSGVNSNTWFEFERAAIFDKTSVRQMSLVLTDLYKL